MADIRVFSGGAPKDIFTQLAPKFEAKSGYTVALSYMVMTDIKDRLAANDVPDILVMPVNLLDGLQKDGTVRGQGRGVLGIIGLGVVARVGAPKLDISTPDKLRAALHAAKTIVHATPGATPSGSHSDMLMKKLGINADKVLHKPGLAGGVQLVADGTADLGIYPASEIVGIAGTQVVGRLPAELQLSIVYGAAVTAKSAAPDAAASFIAFVTDLANRPVWAARGFDPPP